MSAKEYETKNLDLATFLQVNETKPMKLTRVKKSEDNRNISVFVFEDVEEREQIVSHFFAGQDDFVSASRFATAQRQLKSWLHNTTV
jgi:hypothetical protein